MKAPERYYQGRRVCFAPPDREWLELQYWEMGKSLVQIAEEQDTSHHTVWLWMDKIKVPRRTKQQCAERHSERMSGPGNPAWNGGTSRNYQARTMVNRSQVCEWCGTTEDIQVHHQDHNVANGEPGNLALLCGTCNKLESHLWALQQGGRAEVLIDKADHKIEISFTKVEV